MNLVTKNIYFALFCLLSVLSGCRKSEDYKEMNGIVWNTTYHILYRSGSNLNDSVLKILDNVGRSVSAFDSTSVVSRINNNQSFVVDKYFKDVYAKSVEINRISNGAFDPTISPLINAWGFGYENRMCDTLNIDSLMKFVGIGKSRIDGERLVKDDERLSFNFSALAKGYGCDQVAEMFMRNDVIDFLIEIGGEVVAHGDGPRKMSWNVAVEVPSDDLNRGVHTILKLNNKAMATSGNYRNYREVNGKRIAHTIDPMTGMPRSTDILSATIVADDCMTADAFATACMVMGSTSAKIMTDSVGVAALFILDNGMTWSSEKFKELEIID